MSWFTPGAASKLLGSVERANQRVAAQVRGEPDLELRTLGSGLEVRIERNASRLVALAPTAELDALEALGRAEGLRWVSVPVPTDSTNPLERDLGLRARGWFRSSPGAETYVRALYPSTRERELTRNAARRLLDLSNLRAAVGVVAEEQGASDIVALQDDDRLLLRWSNSPYRTGSMGHASVTADTDYRPEQWQTILRRLHALNETFLFQDRSYRPTLEVNANAVAIQGGYFSGSIDTHTRELQLNGLLVPSLVGHLEQRAGELDIGSFRLRPELRSPEHADQLRLYLGPDGFQTLRIDPARADDLERAYRATMEQLLGGFGFRSKRGTGIETDLVKGGEFSLRDGVPREGPPPVLRLLCALQAALLRRQETADASWLIQPADEALQVTFYLENGPLQVRVGYDAEALDFRGARNGFRLPLPMYAAFQAAIHDADEALEDADARNLPSIDLLPNVAIRPALLETT